eukprot:TRINITY_DN1185_c0_g1_i1.p1 TRINITY_DN1185_c0_g1~~TRINITY_DN1185_c0_g1_i1.p1  ORF type:complete len:218 (-),score=33.07 TRINITY_DN1185_c0_g1_i1:330-983(-)
MSTKSTPILSLLTKGGADKHTAPIAMPPRKAAVDEESNELGDEGALSISKLIAQWKESPVRTSPIAGLSSPLSKEASAKISTTTPTTTTTNTAIPSSPLRLSSPHLHRASTPTLHSPHHTPKTSGIDYTIPKPTKYTTFDISQPHSHRRPTTLTTFNLESWVKYHETLHSDPITTFTFYANEPINGVYPTYRTYVFHQGNHDHSTPSCAPSPMHKAQ